MATAKDSVTAKQAKRSMEVLLEALTPDLIEAYQRVAGDERAWERAKANPAKLLKQARVTLPKGVSLSLQEKPAPDTDGGWPMYGKLVYYRCIRMCKLVGTGASRSWVCHDFCLVRFEKDPFPNPVAWAGAKPPGGG